jgi:hypothetical protein
MRVFLFLIGLALLAACVKRTSSQVVPIVNFKELANVQKTTNGDTAVMVLDYEDGDGDLFLDKSTQDPNLIFTTYHYEAASGKFVGTFDLLTNDTIRYSTKILQPGGGIYKGKYIKGNIYVPLTQFRASKNDKILKFVGFMVDLAGHKSNTFVSPTYSLDF